MEHLFNQWAFIGIDTITNNSEKTTFDLKRIFTPSISHSSQVSSFHRFQGK
jgi:hypothetical protein